MTEILLEGLEFYAHHGFYKEEQQLGNRFQVDIRIRAELNAASESDSLSQTIDYVEVYKLIQTQMGQKFKLLETLSSRIIQDIRVNFPAVSTVDCTVSKFNPPISGLCRRVAVSQSWSK